MAPSSFILAPMPKSCRCFQCLGYSVVVKKFGFCFNPIGLARGLGLWCGPWSTFRQEKTCCQLVAAETGAQMVDGRGTLISTRLVKGKPTINCLAYSLLGTGNEDKLWVNQGEYTLSPHY